jgi:hypothetical protein
MIKKYTSLPGSYVRALNKYITEPTIKSPASNGRQKPGNPGALLADLKSASKKA